MQNIQWNLSNSYTKLPGHFYSRQAPRPVRSPRPVILNHALAASLGVPLEPEVLAGNAVPQGAEPFAQAYAGHQFGHFTMLGDGRALLLGEQITPSGERMDVQLKGSGRTPYSRGGDGRAECDRVFKQCPAQGMPVPRKRSADADAGRGFGRHDAGYAGD